MVDDDSDDAELFNFALQEVQPGTTFVHYLQAEELLTELSCGNYPDLLVIDLNMPTITGLQCLRLLREGPYRRDLPVVILTCSERPSDIEACYDLGCNLYFTKPYSTEELKLMIERALQMRAV